MKPVRRLILIRHAKSSWKDLSLADFDRPLNARGRRNGPVMAAYASRSIEPPDLVISSPSVRTRLTAAFFLEAGFFSEDALVYDKRLYEAGARQLEAIVRATAPDIRSLALIGHNPGLTSLCNLIAPTDPLDNIPTLGIVELVLNIDSWAEAGSGGGRRVSFVTPKSLPGEK